MSLEWSVEKGSLICDMCGEELDYNAKFDSEFCPKCNEWKVDTCGDPECVFCKDRPDRPSQVKKEEE